MDRARLFVLAVGRPVVLGGLTVGALWFGAPSLPTSGPDTLFVGSIAAGFLALVFGSNARSRTGYRNDRRVVLSHPEEDATPGPLSPTFFGLTVWALSTFVGCWVVLLAVPLG